MGHTCGSKPRASLFGLAPGGVCRATECYHRRGALLPHHFTLTGIICMTLRRFIFCCTFRGLAPPRRYLAPCPGSPDFPPRLRAAIAWPTPPRMVGIYRLISKEKRLSGATRGLPGSWVGDRVLARGLGESANMAGKGRHNVAVRICSGQLARERCGQFV